MLIIDQRFPKFLQQFCWRVFLLCTPWKTGNVFLCISWIMNKTFFTFLIQVHTFSNLSFFRQKCEILFRDLYRCHFNMQRVRDNYNIQLEARHNICLGSYGLKKKLKSVVVIQYITSCPCPCVLKESQKRDSWMATGFPCDNSMCNCDV